MTAPERIWLQDAGDYDHAAQFEVTWCAETQDDADTEYIRADMPPTLSAALDLPEIKALVDASKGLLLAHDHGSGLEVWRNTLGRMRAALRAIEDAGR